MSITSDVASRELAGNESGHGDHLPRPGFTGRGARARRRRRRDRRARPRPAGLPCRPQAARRPGREALLDAAPGLYTDPRSAAAFDAVTLSLCVVALRMEMLRYDSWHDPLTGLFDRRTFDRLLDMSVARSVRYRWPFTLVLVDLDDLKRSTTRGSPGGRRRAPGARRAVPASPPLRRQRGPIGGDEFALILPSPTPRRPAAARAHRRLPGANASVPAFSYGVAQCPTEAETAAELCPRRHAALRSQSQREVVTWPDRGTSTISSSSCASSRACAPPASPNTTTCSSCRSRWPASAAPSPAPAGRRASRPATPTSRSRSRSCAGGPSRCRHGAGRSPTPTSPPTTERVAARRRRAARAQQPHRRGDRETRPAARGARVPRHRRARGPPHLRGPPHDRTRRRGAGCRRGRATSRVRASVADARCASSGPRSSTERRRRDLVVVAVAVDADDGARSTASRPAGAAIEAAARSTLDALNRRLGPVLRPESVGPGAW